MTSTSRTDWLRWRPTDCSRSSSTGKTTWSWTPSESGQARSKSTSSPCTGSGTTAPRIGQGFSWSVSGSSGWACRYSQRCRRQINQGQFRNPLVISMPRTLRKLANHGPNRVYAAEKRENGHEIGCVWGGGSIGVMIDRKRTSESFRNLGAV